MLDVRLGHDQVEEREVIAEREHALGLGHLRVLAELGAEERLGHRRHVLVREADVGAREEARRPGFTAGTPSLPASASTIDVRGDDLLAERHRPRRRRDRRAARPRPPGARWL